MNPPSGEDPPPAAADIPRLAERLFREESGKLVSLLTAHLGVARLQLAEDVVQDALLRALRTWPFYGVPDKPAAWLLQTARHLAIDALRRERTFREKEPAIIAFVEDWRTRDATDAPAFDGEIADARLRLMFACCHPALTADVQVALALKTLGGLSPAEIARAFLSTEAAVTKRLTRARQRLRDEDVRFEIPAGPELPARLDAVLRAIYLLFNEGYNASHAGTLVREDLCAEAIRLGQLLVTHPVGRHPRGHALLALMILNAARLAARVDEATGRLLRLDEQDRSRWSRPLIACGLRHLAEAATGDEMSEYHLQAAISACHCVAPSAAATDWARILAHYDALLRIHPSPVVALNRAVAVAEVHGPAAGLAALKHVADHPDLERYHLLYAVRGDFQARRENFAEAATDLRAALQLTGNPAERAALQARLELCIQPER